MRPLKKASGLAVICWLLCACPLVAGQESPPPSERAVSLVKVGPVDVSNGEHVTLQRPVADLFGRAWNYQGKEFYGLLKFREGSRWFVAASSRSEPGGIFNIEGMRFPQDGDFDLVVTLHERDALPVGSWIDESQWESASLALTQRITVTVEGSPEDEGAAESEPQLSIVSIADVSLNPREVNSVPAGGDVILKARGLTDSKFYLVLRAPYTDLCYVLGPAKKDATPDTYRLHSVSFEIPGDPQQIHFDLIAFASAAPVRAGPMSWQSFRLADNATSPTVRILIEGRQPRSDGLRVPFIAITRVGQHTFTAEPAANRKPAVEQGDPVEVSAYERTTEGAALWALTRPKGSDLWLAQGPLIPRGTLASEVEDGRTPVTWVLPSLRFERPERNGPEGNEFEVLAVLSNSVFPNSWISSASLSAQTIETISRPVPVSVNGSTGPSHVPLSITRIGSQEAAADEELTVGNAETIVIERPEDLSPAFRIYLAKHVSGTNMWSFVEAIPNGNTHFIPALSFSNPHAEEGTRYQLVAIVTKGPLPAFQAEYQEFIPHVITASELINVRYSRAALFGFQRWLSSWFFGEPGPETPGVTKVETMWWLWLIVIVAVVLLICAALAWLCFNSNPALAGEIADTLQKGHAAAKKRFELPESANPAYALLGVGLLAVVWYIIKYYYLSLYTMIVATATGLPQKASGELVLWLVLVTALAGIFADIGAKLPEQATKAPAEDGVPREAASADGKSSGINVYKLISVYSLVIAVILWLCEGGIYFAYFYEASVKNSLLLATLAFLAGFLISMTETITFFVITELSLLPVGWLILFIVLAPLYLLSLCFRFLQRVFEGRRRPEYHRNTSSPPESDGGRPRPAAAIAPAEQEEV